MRTDQRRREIVRRLYLTGYAEARELAETLGVNSSTIRRDLDQLARAGHVQRTHGGARLVAEAVDLPYAMKEREHLAAKVAIGRAGAALVADGERILLDSGSTTYELAKQLRGRQDLTIVTNDLRIAQLVAGFPGIQLLVTGGELLRSTYTLFGDRAVAFVRELSVDHAFLGADAIDVASGITNTNTLEVPLKRAMIDVAGAALVLADSSKFGRRALVRVAEIAEVDLVITDDALAPDVAATFGDVVRRVPLEDAVAVLTGPGENGNEPQGAS
jgi:DeoR family transcriptional regulator of aga operon